MNNYFSSLEEEVPEHNRLHGNIALKTHSIWESISNTKKDDINENSYEQFKSLVRKQGIGHTKLKSTCKKCGGTGHFSYQCRNFIKLPSKSKPNNELNELIPSDDEESPKIEKEKKRKKKKKKRRDSSSSDDEERKKEKKKRKKEKKKKKRKYDSSDDERREKRKYDSSDDEKLEKKRRKKEKSKSKKDK